MSKAAVPPASIALWSSLRRWRMRRASRRGILSMSRWACGVKRVTCPIRSALLGTEQGGHLFEGDRSVRALRLRLVGQLVEPCLFGDSAQALVLLDADSCLLTSARSSA